MTNTTPPQKFTYAVTAVGTGAVVWRCDIGNPAGDHLQHMVLTGVAVGHTDEVSVPGPLRSVVRDRANPEDTFTGEVAAIMNSVEIVDSGKRQ